MRFLPKNFHKIKDFLLCCNALPKILATYFGNQTECKQSMQCEPK